MVILEPFAVKSCTDTSDSVCLARGTCRGDEGPSIDDTALASVDVLGYERKEELLQSPPGTPLIHLLGLGFK
ncbi:hypothetical protein YC2023_018422 [Brassica napus]